jgi:hypothetical protein
MKIQRTDLGLAVVLGSVYSIICTVRMLHNCYKYICGTAIVPSCIVLEGFTEGLSKHGAAALSHRLLS